MKQWALGEIRNGYPVLAKKDRKTLLLISDDIQFPSGVGTISRNLVLGTCHYFNWVQIGGAANHPHNGKRILLSEAVQKENGVPEASVEVYAVNGYGNPQMIRDLIEIHNIQAIFHITDPRFFTWLYAMKSELEQKCPLIYLNLWDDAPIPQYNEPAYRSCSMLLNINRQTHQMNKMILADDLVDMYNHEVKLDSNDICPILSDYIPHGVDSDVFFKLPENDEKLLKLKLDIFKEKSDSLKFVYFYNNRNIRRKQLIDLIIAYRDVCTKNPVIKLTSALLLHTDIRDDNGTDLPVVIQDLAPNFNIYIIDKKMIPEEMNLLYNIVDVTMNIASNEGFGLSSLESIMTETMVISAVTGGLQDQMRFEDEYGQWIEFDNDFVSNHIGRYKKCGSWAIPVFPKVLSCQGSIPTPYIFDDKVSYFDVSDAMKLVFDMPKEERDRNGKIGRIWVMSEESRMSSSIMCRYIIKDIELLLEFWRPTRTVELIGINREATKVRVGPIGIPEKMYN